MLAPPALIASAGQQYCQGAHLQNSHGSWGEGVREFRGTVRPLPQEQPGLRPDQGAALLLHRAEHQRSRRMITCTRPLTAGGLVRSLARLRLRCAAGHPDDLQGALDGLVPDAQAPGRCHRRRGCRYR